MAKLKLFGNWIPWNQLPLAEGLPLADIILNEEANITFANLIAQYASKAQLLQADSSNRLHVTPYQAEGISFSYSVTLAAGASGTYILPAGRFLQQAFMSVTAQPVAVYYSWDVGATFTTLPAQNNVSTTTAMGLSGLGVNGIKLINNSVGNSTIQILGAYV